MPTPFHLLELVPIERRLVEQYLNTYCRETGRFDPRLATDEAGPIELHSYIKAWRTAGCRADSGAGYKNTRNAASGA